MARFSGCPAATPMQIRRLHPTMPGRVPIRGAALAVACLGLPAAAQAAVTPPHPTTLSHGWQVRSERAAPAEPQLPPPEESAPESSPSSLARVKGHASQASPYRSTIVPDVFDARAL